MIEQLPTIEQAIDWYQDRLNGLARSWGGYPGQVSAVGDDHVCSAEFDDFTTHTEPVLNVWTHDEFIVHVCDRGYGGEEL
jgi:hypothetical protein